MDDFFYFIVTECDSYFLKQSDFHVIEIFAGLSVNIFNQPLEIQRQTVEIIVKRGILHELSH